MPETIIFLKVDSGGMKTRVLAGAVNSIDKNRPFLYFENNNWLSSPAIKQIYLWPISPIGLLFCITDQIIIECFRKIFFQHRCSLICFVFLSVEFRCLLFALGCRPRPLDAR